MKTEISTSFSKKINLANYGLGAYESEDFFVSLKRELEVTEPENVVHDTAEFTSHLNWEAEQIVDALIRDRLKTLIKNRSNQ